MFAAIPGQVVCSNFDDLGERGEKVRREEEGEREREKRERGERIDNP